MAKESQPIRLSYVNDARIIKIEETAPKHLPVDAQRLYNTITNRNELTQVEKVPKFTCLRPASCLGLKIYYLGYYSRTNKFGNLKGKNGV